MVLLVDINLYRRPFSIRRTSSIYTITFISLVVVETSKGAIVQQRRVYGESKYLSLRFKIHKWGEACLVPDQMNQKDDAATAR